MWSTPTRGQVLSDQAAPVLLLILSLQVACVGRIFLPQRRKGAKKTLLKRGSALRLCALAGESCVSKFLPDYFSGWTFSVPARLAPSIDLHAHQVLLTSSAKNQLAHWSKALGVGNSQWFLSSVQNSSRSPAAEQISLDHEAINAPDGWSVLRSVFTAVRHVRE